VKSFRFYLAHRVSPPARFVADYQPEELSRFRSMFQPIAQQYNRCMRLAYIIVSSGIVSLLAGLVWPAFLSWGLAGFMACVSLFLLLTFISPVPNCPACHNALEAPLGDYCPECGVAAVHRGHWIGCPWCASCGRKLSASKARHYTIRACTHCGVFLDDEGI
jgi:predicted RNA-binding Zn-ribbon protein involved in translation (DUF1610 family)